MDEQNAVWPFFAWSPLATDMTLLALAAYAPTDDERSERLQALASEIEAVEASRDSDLVASAKRAMESLAKSDPEAAARVAREYASSDSKEG